MISLVPKPLALIILDGWGISRQKNGNAISLANTPNMDNLMKKYPWTQISASGEDVGLPPGQMGNSEVGHLNIGAGRIVYQELTRINKDIKEKTFFKNPVILEAARKAKANNGALHLVGLLSDGGVHSHINHLFALLELAKSENVENVYVHAILDGRDVAPDNAGDYILMLQNKMKELKIGQIATVSGRYYTMDRDNRWERTEKAFNALVKGEGLKAANALHGVEQSYEKDENDEFVRPTVIIDEKGNPIAKIEPDDSLVFFNFRPDRARQMTRAITEESFTEFSRGLSYLPPYYVCFTQYDEKYNLPIAFSHMELTNTLGDVLDSLAKKQLRIAETEKYAHVTFFFNGGKEEPGVYEKRKLIPSPRIATYNLKPEMSAHEVTEELIKEIELGGHDLIVLNYANADMVGHTGVLEAAIKAVETVDECLGKAIEALLNKGGAALITADHGNAENMIDLKKNSPHTAHTSNCTPFIVVSNNKYKLKKDAILADIAPTILEILNIEIPAEMTGKSIIK